MTDTTLETWLRCPACKSDDVEVMAINEECSDDSVAREFMISCKDCPETHSFQ